MVAIIQHLLLIAIAAMTAFLSFRWINKSHFISILVFAVIALLPWSLVASHKILTETLYTFTEVLMIVLFMEAWRSRRPLIWIAAGFALMASVFVRPEGVLFFAVIACIFFIHGRRQRRVWSSFLCWTLTVMALSSLWCATNFYARGFWGFTTLGGLEIFCKSADLLDLGLIKDPAFAAALRPYYEPRDPRLSDSAWVMYGQDGPIAKLRQEGLIRPSENAMLWRLAGTAVRAHPLRLVYDQTRRTFVFFRSMYALPAPSGTMSAVFPTISSLELYHAFAEQNPDVLAVAGFSRSTSKDYLTAVRKYPLFPFQFSGWVSALCWPLRTLEASIPICLIGAFLLYGLRNRDLLFDFLALTLLFHVALASFDSEKTVRHAVPVEPICILIVLRAITHDVRLFQSRN